MVAETKIKVWAINILILVSACFAIYFGLYNDEILGEQKELLLMYGNKNWVRV